MSEQEGSLMFLTTHKTLTREQRAALESAQPSELPALAESMGMKVAQGDTHRRERMKSILVLKVSEQLTRLGLKRLRNMIEHDGLPIQSFPPMPAVKPPKQPAPSNVESLLTQMLEEQLTEQRKTNQLLSLLIDALAE